MCMHDAQHFYRADGDWDGDDRRIYFTTTDRGNTNSDTSFNLFTSDYPYGGGPSEFDRNLGNHDGFLLVGRYIFAQRTDSNGVVALYVSDRRQPFKKAMIPLPDDHERYIMEYKCACIVYIQYSCTYMHMVSYVGYIIT